MTRLGVFLAAICGVLALLAATFAGVRASHKTASPKQAAEMSSYAAVKTAAPQSTDAAEKKDGDDDDAVIRFVKNPEPLPHF